MIVSVWSLIRRTYNGVIIDHDRPNVTTDVDAKPIICEVRYFEYSRTGQLMSVSYMQMSVDCLYCLPSIARSKFVHEH